MTLEYRIYRPTSHRPLSSVLLGAAPLPEPEVAIAPLAEVPAEATVLQEPLVPDERCESASWSPHAIDEALVTILNGTRPGEPLRAAYARVEREIAALFVTVPTTDALALQQRFSEPAGGDTAAQAFGRLLAERRERLLGLLGRVARGLVR